MDWYLLLAAILLPALSAALCFILKNQKVRIAVVSISTLLLFAVAGGFIALIMNSPEGKLVFQMDEHVLEIVGWLIKGFDFLLLCYIGYFGIKHKKAIVLALTVLQFIPWVLFEIFGVFGKVHEPAQAFVIDHLSLIMIMLISIIGPIVTFFGLGYMKEHEHHLHLKVSRQPRFFMILFIFLGAMNALVMTDNLSWMYFFWEVTTLCSFLLISHDGTEIAVKNGLRALWLNSVGGVAFIIAILMVNTSLGTLSIQAISNSGMQGAFAGMMPVALGLLCIAGFTKSAQFPFQSWLLGAMVAPTPVSALLHSSTMVKAGVYLIIRIAPAFAGTRLGQLVAVAGGFTFVAASAIAISQSNAKKVLAYSTIANLGLIICCAGIGTRISLAAAVLLMIFHAVSKGLLFLCVGTIEMGIGSRDIEDMQGLFKKMPFTTVITVIGQVSMLLPPFGVLITKWMAIETAIHLPLVLVFIILGSAFTIVFWSKWIGIILTMSYKPKYYMEKLSFSIKAALSVLIALVMAASIGIVPLYNQFVKPQITAFNIADKEMLSGTGMGLWLEKVNQVVYGGFSSIIFFGVILLLIVAIPIIINRIKPARLKPPYLCGSNVDDDLRGLEFVSPADKVEKVVVRNYYMASVFGENKLTFWSNLSAGAIIIIMLGVVIGL
ncbi:NADH-quinone oxidoreductase subunit L [Ruminiclostridium cellulolyticum]|uniref:NADH/Ubiquinone/plastoquinone (Complex I) n=1 Tax=Ruminiclostridium cellulolyticum (strain ATCC 35319 / DSM 5812 / JCM 6584 / H10) TaxID=394503 RepID=B8I1M5_RUMCH|nr:proton-conducting transporter membrane subunit [Ruminiclostridium cellulolyticum]ACL77660.1 NADH/Ubiquinone/plastoquinone (complex I) [Ruminiclostridium cellulolyticum H10]